MVPEDGARQIGAMPIPTKPESDRTAACRRHVERVRRHGRATVALIERVRLNIRRRADTYAAAPPSRRHSIDR
jgi:hypothetical protein